MKMLLTSVALSAMLVVPAHAQDEAASPAMLSEIAMSEQLIALGMARGEPILVLAGIRLRATLGGETAGIADGLTSREDAFALALELAAGDPSLLAVIEDTDAESARRMPICGPLWCY